MPDWSSIESTVIGAIIVGVLVFFWKRIVTGLEFVWKRIRMGRRTQTRDSAESLDLRFVEFRSVCGVSQQKDGKWIGQIQTEWDVTNVSKSGMAAHLLRARLAKPRLRDGRSEFEEARGHVLVVDIHPNRTQRMVIHFFVVLPPDKLKSLTLHIVVIDQLSGEHSLRRIKLKPQIAQPATTGQP